VIFFGRQKGVSKASHVISLILENHGNHGGAKTEHLDLLNPLEMESILRLPNQSIHQSCQYQYILYRKFLKFVIFLMHLVDVSRVIFVNLFIKRTAHVIFTTAPKVVARVHSVTLYIQKTKIDVLVLDHATEHHAPRVLVLDLVTPNLIALLPNPTAHLVHHRVPVVHDPGLDLDVRVLAHDVP